MTDKLAWNDIHGKAQGAGVGGAIGVIVVIILDALVGLDAAISAILVGSIATVSSYLMPTTPPWKK